MKIIIFMERLSARCRKERLTDICTQMLPAMWRFWGSADDRNLGVYIEILHNYKMSDDQKGETYIIFLTKQGTEDDGGGIIVM